MASKVPVSSTFVGGDDGISRYGPESEFEFGLLLSQTFSSFNNCFWDTSFFEHILSTAQQNSRIDK